MKKYTKHTYTVHLYPQPYQYTVRAVSKAMAVEQALEMDKWEFPDIYKAKATREEE